MLNRNCFFFLSALFFSLNISIAHAGERFISAPKPLVPLLERFDDYVEKKMRANKEPGCAIAIVYRNRLIFMKTYGVRSVRTRQPVTFNTVFQLGSVSKSVSATLAAILQARGLFDIDDPVSRYVPGFQLKGLSKDAFRIRNVLSHTSGVPRAGFNTLIERNTPYQKLLSIAQRSTLRSPGKQYDYHNVMFSLIGNVIERTTRMSFQTALQRYLLNPLRMTQTQASYEGLMSSPDRAFPHVKNAKGVFLSASNYSQTYYSVTPAAGVSSSVRDMSNFLALQMGAYPDLIESKALREFHQPHVRTPDSFHWVNTRRDGLFNAYYGLGWRILDFARYRMVFHSGWLRGFTNFIGFIPEKQVGIIVLHNSETRFPSVVAKQFFDIFLGLPEERE